MAAALAAGLIAIFASLAFAAEITRTEYKEAVEPICHVNARANERILKGVRQEVKADKLKLAATKFAKAASALKKTWRELSAVPKPTEDEARLNKWLSYIKSEIGYFEQAAKVLKEGKKSKLPRIVVRLEQTARLANSEVLPFGFHWCKSKPASSYT
ncbi:MAG: hypothetical protein ACTHNP_07080 [Solirubrobacterales bacterium]